jgi:hypothetical protein
MGLCCYQIVVTPDGRFAVLQGDPLAAEIEQLEVPKRVRTEARIEVGGAHRADGYLVEIAIPWEQLGVLEPESGRRFDLDVAWNDWIEDHPLLPEIPLDLHNLAALETREKSRVRPLPPTIPWEEREAIVARAYFPWSLAGRRSFGYPRTWSTVRLSGQPPLPTRLTRRLGAERLLSQEGLSVTEVAARLGYADPSHFSKRFKEAFRIPPSRVARRSGASASISGGVVN